MQDPSMCFGDEDTCVCLHEEDAMPACPTCGSHECDETSDQNEWWCNVCGTWWCADDDPDAVHVPTVAKAYEIVAKMVQDAMRGE